MELYNVVELSERTSDTALQAHNVTTAIVSCCCTLLHSHAASSNSVTSECLFITALHCMHAVIPMAKVAVCLSVRPSVRHTREL